MGWRAPGGSGEFNEKNLLQVEMKSGSQFP